MNEFPTTPFSDKNDKPLEKKEKVVDISKFTIPKKVRVTFKEKGESK